MEKVSLRLEGWEGQASEPGEKASTGPQPSVHALSCPTLVLGSSYARGPDMVKIESLLDSGSAKPTLPPSKKTRSTAVLVGCL